jgi:hypothetical protein
VSSRRLAFAVSIENIISWVHIIFSLLYLSSYIFYSAPIFWLPGRDVYKRRKKARVLESSQVSRKKVIENDFRELRTFLLLRSCCDEISMRWIYG